MSAKRFSASSDWAPGPEAGKVMLGVAAYIRKHTLGA